MLMGAANHHVPGVEFSTGSVGHGLSIGCGLALSGKKKNLPYRVVDVCTGDMGRGQVYKNDIETWMPSRNGYGETHSCSTFHEFQARRLGIKYETKEGQKKFVHTLNNTCIASPRILIPILEIYQNRDGSVTVPDVLRPYMGGKERVERRF